MIIIEIIGNGSDRARVQARLQQRSVDISSQVSIWRLIHFLNALHFYRRPPTGYQSTAMQGR